MSCEASERNYCWERTKVAWSPRRQSRSCDRSNQSQWQLRWNHSRNPLTGPFINLTPQEFHLPIATSDLGDRSSAPHPTILRLAWLMSHQPEASVTAPQSKNTGWLTSFRRQSEPRVHYPRQARAVVEQIKELLTFGEFEPVVSVERESTAIPGSEKVLKRYAFVWSW